MNYSINDYNPKYYKYGMRLRGCSPGAQPHGVIRMWNSIKYWNIIIYNRKLTDKELKDYDLDYLGEVTVQEALMHTD